MDTLIHSRQYHSQETFREEQRRLFSRTWICVGSTDELRQHNDFIAREVGGQSVIVHRFQDQLRAFLNVCTHRFNRLHTERQGNRPLQCGYHGWTFDEAGLPSAIPKRPRFDDLTPERLCGLRLTRWRVETCGKLVFVCRHENAPALSDFLGSAAETIRAMTAACGALIDENVMTIRANWKILVENTLESYHVGFIHPNTFSRLAAAEGEFAWQPPHSSWRTPLGPKFMARMDRVMKLFDSRPLKFDGYWHQLIFPNLTLASTQGTSYSVQYFEPVGSNETLFRSLVYQTALGEVSEGTKTAVDAMNQSVREFNRAVFSEDKEVCEQVQRGVAEIDQPGILSDEELRVGDFQKHYLRMMEAGA